MNTPIPQRSDNLDLGKQLSHIFWCAVQENRRIVEKIARECDALAMDCCYDTTLTGISAIDVFGPAGPESENRKRLIHSLETFQKRLKGQTDSLVHNAESMDELLSNILRILGPA